MPSKSCQASFGAYYSIYSEQELQGSFIRRGVSTYREIEYHITPIWDLDTHAYEYSKGRTGV